MNEDNILPITKATRDFTFDVDATDVRLGALSDAVKEGRYLLRCTDLECVPKKDGTGHNIRFTWQVVEPKDCSEVGKTIVAYHPIKAGPQDEDTKKKNFYVTAAIIAIASAGGKELTGMLKGISPKNIVGKCAAAYVVEEETDSGVEVGSVKTYLYKEQYLMNPGPVDRGPVQERPEVAEQKAAAAEDIMDKEMPAAEPTPPTSDDSDAASMLDDLI